MARFFLVLVVVGGIVGIGWYVLKYEAAFSNGDFVNTEKLPANLVYAYANASSDEIFVTSPKPGESVTATILVKGYARGHWYFEGVFPVDVTNADGVVIGSGRGTADAEWMTEGFVPFTGEVYLKSLYAGPATVVLKKDNPSGKASNNGSLSFPVMIQ